MEFEYLEEPILRETQYSPSPTAIISSTGTTSASPDHQSSDSSPYDDCNRGGESSFCATLEMEEVPKSESEQLRLSWLRSQVVGAAAEFSSPFGRRRLIYADHTASGRSLLYIENFIVKNVLPFYGNTHTCDSFVGNRTTKMVGEAVKYLKKCLGVGADDALLLCGQGTTSAIKRLQEVMGIAVPSTLRDRMLGSDLIGMEERWLVFVGPYEHHSNLLSWRQSLAQVIEIGLDEDGLLDMEALRLQLESYKYSNRPILGSFSACSNLTGIYSDTRAIARLLHQYGGFACFDFAASGPYVEIKMRSGQMDGYDGIFLSPHKFVGGPGTPGILVMSKALYQLRSLPPSTCGGGTVAYVNGFNPKDTVYCEDIEERENGGTPQIIQTIRAASAFWVKEYIGYQIIEKQEQLHVKRALERLLPNQNIWILGNTSAQRLAILSFLVYSTTNCSKAATKTDIGREGADQGLYMWGETGNSRGKPLHGGFVAALLNDLFGIQARGGCDCAAPYGHNLLKIDNTLSHAYRSAIQKGYLGVKPGWTRISFPYYMSNDELESILAALEFIAMYGQRFLPLYNFSLRSGSWTYKKKALQDLIGKTNFNFDVDSLPTHGDNATQGKSSKDGNNKLLTKFSLYLETATNIANCLPKFPPQHRLLEDIDINMLYFRV